MKAAIAPPPSFPGRTCYAVQPYPHKRTQQACFSPPRPANHTARHGAACATGWPSSAFSEALGALQPTPPPAAVPSKLPGDATAPATPHRTILGPGRCHVSLGQPAATRTTPRARPARIGVRAWPQWVPHTGAYGLMETPFLPNVVESAARRSTVQETSGYTVDVKE